MQGTKAVIAEDSPVKGKKATMEERSEIAAKAVRIIDSANGSVQGLRERDETNEKFYRMEPYDRQAAPHEDACSFSFPMVTEKVDSLVGNMSTLITEGSPYFVYKVSGQQSGYTDVVENTVQFLFEKANFEKYLKLHLLLTALNGNAAYRTTFKVRAKGFHVEQEDSPSAVPGISTDQIAYCGLDIQVIHRGDMIVYPTESSNLLEARFIGHKYYLRRAEIVAKQETGEFLKDEEEFSSSSKREQDSGRSTTWTNIAVDSSTEDEDEYIQCYGGLMKLDTNGDGVEEWHEVVVAYNEKAILSFEPYKYDRPWYFCPTLKHEYNSWYHAGSVAQNLQGLQLALNELMGMYYDGTMAAAFPTALANLDVGNLEDDFAQGKPGRIYGSIGDPKLAVLTATFNPQTFPLILGYIDEMADAVTRVSRASAAQPFRRGTTATEVSSIQQAAAVSGNDYLLTYTGSELCAMADWAREMAYENFDMLKLVYGDQFPAQSKDQLMGGGTWEVSGRSPARTPMGRMQAAQNLLALALQTQSPNIDVQELIRSIVMDSGLPNADRIYVSPEEIQEKMLNEGTGPMGNNPFGGMGGVPGIPGVGTPQMGQATGGTGPFDSGVANLEGAGAA